jgi:hypothetical protein
MIYIYMMAASPALPGRLRPADVGGVVLRLGHHDDADRDLVLFCLEEVAA